MKILVAVHAFPPETFGGTERTVEALARASIAAGHEVVVVAGSLRVGAPSRWDEEQQSGLRVLRVLRADLHSLQANAAQQLTDRNAEVDRRLEAMTATMDRRLETATKTTSAIHQQLGQLGQANAEILARAGIKRPASESVVKYTGAVLYEGSRPLADAGVGADGGLIVVLRRRVPVR